mgnify:CR=1 FL=1
MTSVYLIERVAKYLVEHGTCSTKEIGAALSEPTGRVGDALKHPATRGRWGITKEDWTHIDGRGHPSTVFSINERHYRTYLAQRRPMPWIAKRIAGTPKKPAEPPKPKPEPKAKTKPKLEPKAKTKPKPSGKGRILPTVSSNTPVYNGPHRTVWQPSSPYFKGETA